MSGTSRSAAELNRAHWNSLARLHGAGSDRYYDIAALLSGKSSISRTESSLIESAVNSVSDLDVIHVQCHIGFDSISMARAGARVTGLDFSPTAISKARDIARQCDTPVEFVEADVLSPPEGLHGRFDLAYATVGVLCWIADPDAWMSAVASCLRDAGKLVLLDFHPLSASIISEQPLVLASYTYSGPLHSVCGISYAATAEPVRSPDRIMYRHGLGEIVTAAIRSGFHLDSLAEHTELDFNPDPASEAFTEGPDQLWRRWVGGAPVPIAFSLTATKQSARR